MAYEFYVLDGPTDFYFPHPVRYPNQVTVEVAPGGVVPPSEYEIIGYGATATGVTIRYPGAPVGKDKNLIISRRTEPERISYFEDDVGAPASALNAEFDNMYQLIQDFRGAFATLEPIYDPTNVEEYEGYIAVSVGSEVVFQMLKDIRLEGLTGPALGDIYPDIEGWHEDIEGWHEDIEGWHSQVEQWRQDTWDYKTSAEETISEFESGYTGFDENHGYDFGSVTTAVTYFNRDFGGLS